MTRLFSVRRGAILFVLCIWWSGCSLSNESSLDEEKDPNYLAGRSRRAALNYTGAIEAYEKALETNPRSAAPHLELGLIYYQNVTTNWARAIYHFEKYLELRPRANNADLIRQNIDYCKLALAREVPYTPSNDLVRKEIERLTRDNGDLRKQVDQLKAQLAWRAGATSATGTVVFGPLTASNARSPGADRVLATPEAEYAQAVGRSTASGPANDPEPAAASKTHVIRSGDTPYSNARNYGVKLGSLMSVNPGLDPRRLWYG